MKGLPPNYVPWLPLEATDWLEDRLHPDMKVFEWGSGHSTFWFARRVGHITTVEHWERHRDVYNRDAERFGSQNIDFRFVPPQPGRIHAHPDVDHPDNYFGHLYERSFNEENFEAYVMVIEEFPDHHFDLVFIDGQARAACLKHGPPKVKLGGFLIFDDSDRKRHFTFTLQYLEGWEPHILHGSRSDMTGSFVPGECTFWKRTTL